MGGRTAAAAAREVPDAAYRGELLALPRVHAYVLTFTCVLASGGGNGQHERPLTADDHRGVDT